ncbi:MAG: hypothetical protein HXS41_07050 [Theionarchaea archaeon]|nr:hypothetical protein [Theionarchaea archaeon]MBU7020800.1 hypothetical protein [Theionarchaea archaeon]MBU7034804.1 hypothetical protein [Theionarchaea archaeon]MBU7040283.1 hypothetical protein [Theionarchaea archaeon]
MTMDPENLKKQEAEFFKLRDRILQEADKRHIPLRIIGAIAIRTHCPTFKYLEYDLGRMLTDIDFVGYDKDIKAIRQLFLDLDYREDPAIRAMMSGMGMGKMSKRLIFYEDTLGIHSDVFLDELKFCHVVNFRNRLEIDHPTVTLTDMFLSKLQIVRINEKDIIDSIVLLREHDVGPSDKESVNEDYIARLFAEDWGFWRTATENLGKIKTFAQNYEKLAQEDKKNVVKKIEQLQKRIEDEPKSFKWKMRDKVGDKKQWYEEVEEVVR